MSLSIFPFGSIRFYVTYFDVLLSGENKIWIVTSSYIVDSFVIGQYNYQFTLIIFLTLMSALSEHSYFSFLLSME